MEQNNRFSTWFPQPPDKDHFVQTQGSGRGFDLLFIIYLSKAHQGCEQQQAAGTEWHGLSRCCFLPRPLHTAGLGAFVFLLYFSIDLL